MPERANEIHFRILLRAFSRPAFNIFQRYSKTQTARLNNAGSPKRLDQDVEWMVTAAWRVADGILEPLKRVLHLTPPQRRSESIFSDVRSWALTCM